MNEQGINKSAILLMSLGEQEAVQVLKHLTPREVQKVGTAMAKLKNLSREQVDSVISNFCAHATEQNPALVLDPENYTRSVLHKALGDDKSTDIISRILEGSDTSGIEGLKWIDSPSVAELIRASTPRLSPPSWCIWTATRRAKFWGNSPSNCATTYCCALHARRHSALSLAGT